jgi:hypothetical protein
MLLHAIEGSGDWRGPFHDPAFGPLVAKTTISLGQPDTDLDICVPAPGRIEISPAFAERAGARVLARYALELAWMCGVPGLPRDVANLLAARAAGCFLHILPGDEQSRLLEDPAVPGFSRLAGPVADAASLIFAARHVPGASADPAGLLLAQRLWRFAQPLEALLIDGGDDRLTLDKATGRNRYLCVPYPEPGCIALGSCTASSPSVVAFAAAEQRRQDMFASAIVAGSVAAVRSASSDVTQALLAHFQVADLAEAVLAASGTDATLLLTGLLAAEHPARRIETILMSPSETGSGVPDAVRGQHFACRTASGQAVQKGRAVDGFPPTLGLRTIALRGPDGVPRAAGDVAADCDEAIGRIRAEGGHAVLHVIDGSKTGLLGPDRETCRLLAARFGGALDVVIDACQARIEPEIVRWYLGHGFPVLVTGSKFFAAPGFCGAILFPRERLRRIAGGGRLPDGLGAYADLTEDGVSRRCPGLLLRWAAALEEMRRFAAVPPAAIRNAVDRLGAQARAAIMRDDRLRLIHAPRPEGAFWSDRSSVFTFAARRDGRWMSAAELRPFYAAMTRPMGGAEEGGLRCFLGQPVDLGPGLGGLRIAFNAAQAAGSGDMRAELASVFGKLHMLLDSSDAFP